MPLGNIHIYIYVNSIIIKKSECTGELIHALCSKDVKICHRWRRTWKNNNKTSKTNMMTSSNATFSALLALCAGNSRWPVISPHKGHWCFLQSAPWINGWVNNRDVGDLKRQRAHYDVIVTKIFQPCLHQGRIMLREKWQWTAKPSRLWSTSGWALNTGSNNVQYYGICCVICSTGSIKLQ